MTSETAHSGSYAAKAGDLTTTSQTSVLSKTITGPIVVKFWAYAWSSEDYQFEFYIDSTRYVRKPYSSYFSGWKEYVFQTTSGEHTFKWICTYDGSGGRKQIYLDDVEFIPTTE